MFPRVIQGLLVAGIAYSLVDTGAFLLGGAPAAPAAPAALADDDEVTAAREPGIDLARILQRELFGSPGAAADPAAPQQETMVVTSLPLLLHGVFVGDQGGSVALIAQTGRPGAPFGVGDEVPGGATLEDVRPDHVLLRRAGALEVLHFPRSGEGAAAGRQSGYSAYAGDLEALPGEAPYDELIEETLYVEADYTDTLDEVEAVDYQVPPTASFQLEERGSADP